MTNSRPMRITTYAFSTIIRSIGYGHKELLFLNFGNRVNFIGLFIFERVNVQLVMTIGVKL